jgi:hypothetical protein
LAVAQLVACRHSRAVAKCRDQSYTSRSKSLQRPA